MNLPPDKARLLRQYDNEKKWELICDQVGWNHLSFVCYTRKGSSVATKTIIQTWSGSVLVCVVTTQPMLHCPDSIL